MVHDHFDQTLSKAMIEVMAFTCSCLSGCADVISEHGKYSPEIHYPPPFALTVTFTMSHYVMI